MVEVVIIDVVRTQAGVMIAHNWQDDFFLFVIDKRDYEVVRLTVLLLLTN